MTWINKIIKLLAILLTFGIVVTSASMTYAYFTDRAISNAVSVSFSYISCEISFDGGLTYARYGDLNLDSDTVLKPGYEITTGATMVKSPVGSTSNYYRTHAGYTLDEQKLIDYNLTAEQIKRLQNLCIALNGCELPYYCTESSQWKKNGDFYYHVNSLNIAQSSNAGSETIIFDSRVCFPDIELFNLDLRNLEILMC